MSIKDIVRTLQEKKYDDFRTETKKVLMEKAIEKIEQKKVAVGKTYFNK